MRHVHLTKRRTAPGGQHAASIGMVVLVANLGAGALARSGGPSMDAVPCCDAAGAIVALAGATSRQQFMAAVDPVSACRSC